ncbi:MAG: SRPBCC family protein [Rhizobiaceae bacterium]|nr:SRPBCC family protein [Rhizobiaceae bacterium]
MTELARMDQYGALSEDSTLTIRRVLPGPIDRVWAYLTESELRRKWLAAGEMEMRVGAPFKLTWRNDELSDAPSKRPEGFGEEHSMESEITELDPPHKIAFTWGSTGGVTIELVERANSVLLTLTHRRIRDKSALANIAPGWHAHLDVLAARIEERSFPAFWDHWLHLKEDYRERLPA